MKYVSAVIGAAALLATSPSFAADKSDQTFVKDAIQANLAEVQLGQLAQQKGASDGVRQFGTMLATDHAANNQDATALAQSLNVTPPTAPSASQKRDYDRLAKLSGAKFDQAFAKDMVSDHKKDISQFSKEAKSKDTQVAGYAAKTLPDLQKHLQTAQTLQSQTK
jgi:putative membrane protein